MIKRNLEINDNILSSLKEANVSCKNCSFWKQTSKYENYQNIGDCRGMRAGEIEVGINFYGDGGLDSIETDEDFFCANFKPKDK